MRKWCVNSDFYAVFFFFFRKNTATAPTNQKYCQYRLECKTIGTVEANRSMSLQTLFIEILKKKIV